jgi:hypothetical protein
MVEATGILPCAPTRAAARLTTSYTRLCLCNLVRKVTSTPAVAPKRFYVKTRDGMAT